MKFPIAAALLLVPSISVASTPVQVEMTCPVGGEVFATTEAASCSNFGERQMSFAPVTSCDFVTRLPQCPGNHLPIYKEFSNADIELLKDYMNSESYDSSIDQSRFYLAYIIEQYIRQPDDKIGFMLLLSGLWYDPENTYSDPLFMEAFFFEAASEINHASSEDLPYIQAIVAYAHVLNSQPEQALALLSEAKNSGVTVGILPAYFDAIETCMQDANSNYCNPRAMIPTQ